ncbi:MAG: YdcF family protein [Rickettsiales bacterium]|jgi:uncharacterized SAM-binding protein YcdF (DUF218 family)|nr:YdcF family protein [Rickettsiales bacterium]
MILSTAIKVFTSPSGLLLSAVFALGLIFYNAVPECKWIQSNHIAVLTGDKQRIPKAIEFARSKPRARLLISGAGSTDLKLPSNLDIEIETESKTTYDNSMAVRDWVIRNGFDDVAIITSDYHVWRTLLLTRRAMPFTKIEICAVSSENLTRRQRMDLWVSEFGKYVMTMLGITTRSS